MTFITRISQPEFNIVDTKTLNQWLRIDPDTDQASVDLLLASATDYIEGLTGQVICAADYRITLDTISAATPLDLFPISTISAVIAHLEDGTEVTLADRTDYIARLATTAPSITFLQLPDNTASITINVKAGYTSTIAVPATLQHAAAVLVAAGYDARNALDQATISTVANLISRYRRITVG